MADTQQVYAISLYQPWASMMAKGVKRVETRHWARSLRGVPLAIHAAKNAEEIWWPLQDKRWRIHLEACGHTEVESFPLGCLLAVGWLARCVPTVAVRPNHTGAVYGFTQEELAALRKEYWREPEMLMGDFTPGRTAWLVPYVVELHAPIPLRGMPGVWTLDAPIVEQLAPSLEKLKALVAAGTQDAVAHGAGGG